MVQQEEEEIEEREVRRPVNIPRPVASQRTSLLQNPNESWNDISMEVVEEDLHKPQMPPGIELKLDQIQKSLLKMNEALSKSQTNSPPAVAKPPKPAKPVIRKEEDVIVVVDDSALLSPDAERRQRISSIRESATVLAQLFRQEEQELWKEIKGQ